MENLEVFDIDRTLAKPVGIDLSDNELRIIVGCLNALEYIARMDDEPYLDEDGLKLKERLEGLYRDELQGTLVQAATIPRIDFGS